MSAIELLTGEPVIGILLFIVLAPFIGTIVLGLDRIITARMQGRVGPPLFQPMYDILKLFEKEKMVIHESQNFWIFGYLVFIIITGALFFGGSDILLVIFALTLAEVSLILGAFSSGSPYAHVGAERELIQLMAIEPMIIIAAVGFYEVTNSFNTFEIASYGSPLILVLPGIFIGFVYILTVKLRKSPFDISTSHHAHQELVRGLNTEFAGSTLGMIELAHLYEVVFLLGFLFLFFGFAAPIIGIIVIALVYLLEIFVDNATSRVKWGFMLDSCWIVTAVAGVLNLMALYLILR
ncbi:respiratory-chain NADH dehydrogenase subunit 1 [Methanolacinia petrolearia DSM 11571]|uniref:Respiratory-chain NADH dehydrogenase subunit 1 n=1 Tax=Methanolacinia petrolearia (strain DSM 11571 / OCM 486 / SEBR 4847) TaxID=679926 RepID=E1RH18_METP4|nr:NADH-quinone oxidoreductase subunit H [Methanolacinia petrolearia]ADN35242.1 respiratory-chain NADH dehydrogenase subunit 1 [Methanolacinia petrolearia DSM 11571]